MPHSCAFSIDGHRTALKVIVPVVHPSELDLTGGLVELHPQLADEHLKLAVCFFEISGLLGLLDQHLLLLLERDFSLLILCQQRVELCVKLAKDLLVLGNREV